MILRNIHLSLVALALGILTSCNGTKPSEEALQQSTEEQKITLKLYEAPQKSSFEDAELKLLQATKKSDTSNLYAFNYEVRNYELMAQTNDEKKAHCANSGDGQHIHFILNNKPYKAKYESSFEEKLDEGDNVILSFLSRSYHESIKNQTAHTITVINTQGTEETMVDFDMNQPHLFYSRPKGTYEGEDAKKILVDFFLLNATLSEDGNKVILTVDGVDLTITKWVPYFLEGLEPGEHTFRIKLVDQNNTLIPGKFNDSGDRTVTIK